MTHYGRLTQTLLRWAALLCPDGGLSLAEPKRVRQRLDQTCLHHRI